MKKVILIILFFALAMSLWGSGLNTKIYGKPTEYGQGEKTVYIYYYDTYRYVKDFENIDYFPCKVGKTIDLFNRLNQQKAAMPEEPIKPFIIKTDNDTELEIILHLILYRKHITREWVTDISGGGKEWFLTNPKEILQEAKRYKLTGKEQGGVLAEFHKIRTNWSYYLDRFTHYYPEIKDPMPMDLLFKDPTDRIKRYGQYKEPRKTRKKCDPKYEESYKLARKEVKEFIKGLDKDNGRGI